MTAHALPRPSCGPRGTRGGGVLVMALLALMVVGMAGATLLELSRGIARRRAHALDATQAFYLAEAGLAESFAALGMGRNGRVGTSERPAAFGRGVFWVEVVDHGNGRLELVSHGLHGTARTRVSLLVDRPAADVGGLGLFGGEELALEPGARVDGYDSRRGRYADQLVDGSHAEGGARLGSNGDIRLAGAPGRPTEVFGDAAPGPDERVIASGDVHVTGSREPRREESSLPAVVLPDLERRPALEHGEARPLILPPGDQGYEALRVGDGAELVLRGPALILVDRLVVAAGGSLAIDTTDGPVHLFVAERLELEPGSRVATSGEATDDVVVRVAAEQEDGGPPRVRLAAEGEFHGQVVAPAADALVEAGFELFGGLNARRVRLGPGAALHTDSALATANRFGVPPTERHAWRLVEQDRLSVPGRIADPFTFLGVDPATLPAPRDAHDLSNVHAHLTFKLLGVGPDLEFVGWEGDFDFNLLGLLVVRIERHVVP